jgi:catechol 2,3-dioxygenase-like lactoylglutathione lyase family enzyme
MPRTAPRRQAPAAPDGSSEVDLASSSVCLAAHGALRRGCPGGCPNRSRSQGRELASCRTRARFRSSGPLPLLLKEQPACSPASTSSPSPSTTSIERSPSIATGSACRRPGLSAPSSSATTPIPPGRGDVPTPGRPHPGAVPAHRAGQGRDHPPRPPRQRRVQHRPRGRRQGRGGRAAGQAEAAGASPLGEPHERPWGIYSSYFRDPDGHLWEIIWNPALDLGGS